MAKTIGRLGYLGVGIETSGGSAATASVYLPYTEITMRGHHTPLDVTSSKTSRNIDTGSVLGKKWAEGDVGIDLDVVNSGYLFKLALGNEQLATGTPNVHTFYTTVSGNTPKTATLIFGRDTDVEQYTFCSPDQMTMQVTEGIATLKTTFKGKFPVPGVAQTVTTTSGTVLSFKDMNVKFGADLTTAAAASATPVNEFSLVLANNVEEIWQSGSADVTTVRNKGLSVKGTYTVYFDSETDKNAYYALNKRALQVSFSGNANETLTFRVPRFRLSETDISTGIDTFFMVKASWQAEDIVDSGTATRLMDIVLSNDKATVYA